MFRQWTYQRVLFQKEFQNEQTSSKKHYNCIFELVCSKYAYSVLLNCEVANDVVILSDSSKMRWS